MMKTPTMMAEEVSENSNMFDHGTCPFANPRSTVPSTCSDPREHREREGGALEPAGGRRRAGAAGARSRVAVVVLAVLPAAATRSESARAGMPAATGTAWASAERLARSSAKHTNASVYTAMAE